MTTPLAPTPHEVVAVAQVDAVLLAVWLVVRWFIRLAVEKGLLEPLAALAFRRGLRAADDLTGDRLPDLPPALGGDPDPASDP